MYTPEKIRLVIENVKALFKYQGGLARTVSEYIELADDISNVYDVITKEETTALGMTLYKEEYLLNSSYYPTIEAQRWSKQFADIEDMSVVMIWGFGNGLIAKETMKYGEKVCYIFVEPSKEIFTYAITNYDLTEIFNSDKVFIIVQGWNDFDYENLLTMYLNWHNLALFKERSLPKYKDLFYTQYAKYLKDIKEVCDIIKVNQATASFFATATVVNQINNFEEFIKSKNLRDLRGLLNIEMPAIIVSAGPSLKKNIGVLRQWKGHAFILAVDTALSFLMRNDVIPDAWITIDAVKPVTMFDDERVFSLPAFFYPDSKYEIVNHAKNKGIFCTTGDNYLSCYTSEHGTNLICLASGGSVATSALSVLYEMGARRIILVGQDLAYTGNKDYDTKEYVIAHGNRYNIVDVESVDGGTVRTTEDYYHYLKWFEEAAKIPDLDLIDATEGGARIIGTRELRLVDALEQYGQGTLDLGLLNNIPDMFSQKLQKRLLNNWEPKIIANVNKIKDLAENGYKLADELITMLKCKTYTKSGLSSILKELKGIERRINSFPEHHLVDQFMSKISSVTTANLYGKSTVKVPESQMVALKLRFFYDAMIESSATISNLIREVINSKSEIEKNR